jgi:hypothetical protein
MPALPTRALGLARPIEGGYAVRTWVALLTERQLTRASLLVRLVHSRMMPPEVPSPGSSLSTLRLFGHCKPQEVGDAEVSRLRPESGPPVGLNPEV